MRLPLISGARLQTSFGTYCSSIRSARRSNERGIGTPSSRAVFAWMIMVIFVGCWNGSSPGAAPFKMRSMYSAARCGWSATLAPMLSTAPGNCHAALVHTAGNRKRPGRPLAPDGVES